MRATLGGEDFMRLITLCALLCAFLSAPAAAQDAERLRIHGSNSMAVRLVPAVVRAWLADSGFGQVREVARATGIREIHAVRDGEPLIVEVVGNGSGAGLSSLIEQEAELAMMARAPTASELDAAWQLGDLHSIDQSYVLAVDGVAIAVHPRNPVRSLDVRQLREIFAGRARSWRELGGADVPLRVLAPPAGSAAAEHIRQDVLQGQPLRAERQGYAAIARILASDPSAIAVLPVRHALEGGRALAISDGGVPVAPDRVGLLSEDYPLTRRYTLHGAPMMSALGRSLANYAVGLRGQQAIERAGHLAVLMRPVGGATRATGAEEYRQFVDKARRLPVSLRFDPDHLESPFDARSARDVERLVALMHQPRMRGRQLVIAAFAAPEAGKGMIPMLLSNDRSDALSTLLLARGVAVARARGFGASRMLRRASRHSNERIEVWVL